MTPDARLRDITLAILLKLENRRHLTNLAVAEDIATSMLASLEAREREIEEVLDFFGSFDLLCRVVPVGAIKSRCGVCQRCLSAEFLAKHGRTS